MTPAANDVVILKKKFRKGKWGLCFRERTLGLGMNWQKEV